MLIAPPTLMEAETPEGRNSRHSQEDVPFAQECFGIILSQNEPAIYNAPDRLVGQIVFVLMGLVD